jgi:hypothetical protein
VGRLSKIKRELIQEANRRLLTEQDTGQGCTNHHCGITSHLDRKSSIWPYEGEEGGFEPQADDEWNIFGSKTIDEAMDIIRDSKNMQHACSLKLTLTSMMEKKNYKKFIEGTTLLKYIDELCDIITPQSAVFGSKPEYVELNTIHGPKLIQK